MQTNNVKKAIALLLAFVLVLGTNTIIANAATTCTYNGVQYKVTSTAKKTVQAIKVTDKTKTSISIPATVKISGKSYKVTAIADNMAKGNKSLKKITIGKNVTKIGKKAFYGCKNLKAVTIKTTKLTTKSVGAHAFKGLHSKVVVTVPNGKAASYKKILKARGLTGSGQTVKESSSNSTKINACDPTKEYFEDKTILGDEACWFKIMYDDDETASTKYSTGDTVKLRSVMNLSSPIYGWWEKDKRVITGNYVQCGICKKYFASDKTCASHNSLELSKIGGCWGNYILGKATSSFQPETWIFVPDSDPCKVVFQYMLPKGVSYKSGSLKMYDSSKKKESYNGYYTVNVSGNILTLTIKDVKSMPFHRPFNYEACLKDITYTPNYNDDITEGLRYSMAVDFEVVVNDNASFSNDIASTITYSYKGYDHSKSFDVSVHTAGLQISNTDANGNSLSGATFDLYQTKTTYESGSNLGVADYVLLKSGIHAGDVIHGLGTGTGRFGNEYQLVQTSAPVGYKEIMPIDFSIYIDTKNGNTVISAEDEEGEALPVKDGIIQLTVVNKASGSDTSAQQNTGNANNTTTDTGNNKPVDTPVSTSTPNVTPTNTELSVVATYYMDGVKDSSMMFTETVPYGETLMNSSNVYDWASTFPGYTLQKITLNGVEVDKLPAKIPDGAEIGYYYVSK